MKQFRDKNGQFCSQKEYEKIAVNGAIDEWVTPEEPPKPVLEILKGIFMKRREP